VSATNSSIVVPSSPLGKRTNLTAVTRIPSSTPTENQRPLSSPINGTGFQSAREDGGLGADRELRIGPGTIAQVYRGAHFVKQISTHGAVPSARFA